MTAYGGGFRVQLQQQQMSFLVESADRMQDRTENGNDYIS